VLGAAVLPDSIGQPFATLVQLQPGVFALCLQNADPRAGDSQMLTGIRLRLRRVDTANNSGASASTGTSANEDGRADGGAGVAWSWDGGKTLGSKQEKIPATAAVALDPPLHLDLDKLSFGLEKLTGVMTVLEANMGKTHGASSSALRLSGPAAVDLPYHPSLQSGTQTLQDPDRLDCRLCGGRDAGKEVPIQEMRAHIAAHILQAQVCVLGVVRWLRLRCGRCAVRFSKQQLA